MLSTNTYFDGKVVSIAFETPEGPATSGVMLPGEFTFGTSQNEVMTVISGALTVQLPGSDEWKTFTKGESFDIAANQSFNVKLDADCAYFCTYE